MSTRSSYIIQTERLGLRDWKASDKEPFIAMNQDPEVMEFFPSLKTAEETISLIDRLQKHIAERAYGFFAVDRLDTGEFIGFIGIVYQTFESHFTPCIEIGWRLQRAHWFNGFATEGAKACIKYAFETLNAEEVYSFTTVLNSKSEKVMRKIGMKKIGEFDHPQLAADDPLLRHILYQIKNDLSSQ